MTAVGVLIVDDNPVNQRVATNLRKMIAALDSGSALIEVAQLLERE